MDKRTNLKTLLLSTVFLLGIVCPALAAPDCGWQALNGNWSTESNWSPYEPTLTNRALINNGGTAQITQDGEVCYNLLVGYDPGESGNVVMSSGTLEMANTGLQYIGGHGTGTFTQSGGTNDLVPVDLHLGVFSDGSGMYELSGTGQLSAREEYIGNMGTGTFTQTGGINGCGWLYVGYASSSNGRYELSGGQLSTGFGGQQNIGYSGIATFIHIGGTNENEGGLYIGRNSTSNGTYQLSGTGQLSANGEIIGWYGTGMFIQNGGTNTVGDIALGRDPGSSGTYIVSGGQLSTASLFVGRDGSGAFNISGAAADITVSNLLSFGANSTFTAVAGSIIHLTGSGFENKSTDPNDLAGLGNLELIFEGGQASIDPFEVAAQDNGAVMKRDFTLGTLTLGRADIGDIKLVNNYDNQPGWEGTEALYVYNLNIGPGSCLDLNGLNLYYINASIDQTATIVENGGSLIQAELLGDFEPDGDVDLADFAAFALYWRQTSCGACGGADLTGEGNVDANDLRELTDNWLAGK